MVIPWLSIFALFLCVHGATVDMDCGQTTKGTVPDAHILSFQFTNTQKQDIRIVDTNNTFVPVLKIKDSAGRYLESTNVTECGEQQCHGKVFTMKALLRGAYTVEMTASKNGGEFNVQMMCSNEPSTEMDEIEGTSTTVYSSKFAVNLPSDSSTETSWCSKDTILPSDCGQFESVRKELCCAMIHFVRSEGTL